MGSSPEVRMGMASRSLQVGGLGSGVMALHPVGPLSASTYWRRRLLLLGGLLVLLVVAKSCAAGPTKASLKKPSGAATSRPASKPSTSPTTRPTVRASATTRPAGEAPACADSAVTLTATTDAATYGLGARPKITMTARNNSAVSCRRDLGSGAVELLVYSGQDRFWSSDDCSLGRAAGVVTLGPGQSQSIVKTWPGVRSAPGCGGSKQAATVGTYQVVARVGTLRRDGAVFAIHA